VTSQILTLAIPQPLYDRYKRQAERTRRSLEDVVLAALAEAVPADGDLPADVAATIAALATLDDATLWGIARSRPPMHDWERRAELGDKRQREGLSDDELREAAALAHRHDLALALRAEAAALLKQRGHDVHILVAGA
jgi:hypothetical protein